VRAILYYRDKPSRGLKELYRRHPPDLDPDPSNAVQSDDRKVPCEPEDVWFVAENYLRETRSDLEELLDDHPAVGIVIFPGMPDLEILAAAHYVQDKQVESGRWGKSPQIEGYPRMIQRFRLWMLRYFGRFYDDKNALTAFGRDLESILHAARRKLKRNPSALCQVSWKIVEARSDKDSRFVRREVPEFQRSIRDVLRNDDLASLVNQIEETMPEDPGGRSDKERDLISDLLWSPGTFLSAVRGRLAPSPPRSRGLPCRRCSLRSSHSRGPRPAALRPALFPTDSAEFRKQPTFHGRQFARHGRMIARIR